MGTLNNLRLIKRILASFWNLQKYKVRKNKKFENIHKSYNALLKPKETHNNDKKS